MFSSRTVAIWYRSARRSIEYSALKEIPVRALSKSITVSSCLSLTWVLYQESIRFSVISERVLRHGGKGESGTCK